MKGWTKDPRVLSTVESLLRRSGWADDLDGDNAHAFVCAFLAALHGSVRKSPLKDAVSLALRAAQKERRVAEPELLVALTLTLVSRDLLRDASSSFWLGQAASEETTRIALVLIAQIPALRASSDKRPETASHAHQLRDAVREASRRLGWEGPAAADPAASALGSALGGFRRDLALRLLSTVPVPTELRSGLSTATELLLRERSSRWSEAPAWMRKALLRAEIADYAASFAFAALALDAEHAANENGQGRRRLTQTAAETIRCAADVDAWFPDRNARRSLDQFVRGVRPSPQEKPMSEKSPVLDTLQSDASDAAWRLAGSQFLKLSREPLVGLLQRHLGPEDTALRARIATFLETPLGNAVLGSLLSVGLAALPPSMGDKPGRLAKELRVKAMTDAGELVADVLMGPLRQVISTYLSDNGGGGLFGSGPGAPTFADPTPKVMTEGTPPVQPPAAVGEESKTKVG
jgi:hypothetical protein